MTGLAGRRLLLVAFVTALANAPAAATLTDGPHHAVSDGRTALPQLAQGRRGGGFGGGGFGGGGGGFRPMPMPAPRYTPPRYAPQTQSPYPAWRGRPTPVPPPAQVTRPGSQPTAPRVLPNATIVRPRSANPTVRVSQQRPSSSAAASPRSVTRALATQQQKRQTSAIRRTAQTPQTWVGSAVKRTAAVGRRTGERSVAVLSGRKSGDGGSSGVRVRQNTGVCAIAHLPAGPAAHRLPDATSDDAVKASDDPVGLSDGRFKVASLTVPFMRSDGTQSDGSSATMPASKPDPSSLHATVDRCGGPMVPFNTHARTFRVGANPNQVHHAFRHTDDLGLSRDSVKQAIRKDVQLALPLSKVTSFMRAITVNGQKLEYRVYRLANGVIHIGRINKKT